jgi:hypothetical protein
MAMKVKVMIAALGMSVALGAGSALAWDLHDTLAPGPTPENADAPPPTEDVPGGADLRLPDVDISMPAFGGSSAVHDSRCADALATHGENSAEAWTQC